MIGERDAWGILGELPVPPQRPPGLQGSEIPPFGDSFRYWRKKLRPGRPWGSREFKTLRKAGERAGCCGEGPGPGVQEWTSPDAWTIHALLASSLWLILF